MAVGFIVAVLATHGPASVLGALAWDKIDHVNEALRLNPSPMERELALRNFVQWRHEHLRGDEKGEAQLFVSKMFEAFGWPGVREAGAEFESRITSDRGTTTFADVMWKPRLILEMKKAGTDLGRHFRQARDYWVGAAPNRPRYVMLCNFDEFWVYDFETQVDEPVDKLRLDDLPERWEVLGFFLPQQLQPRFGNDLVSVTRDAAADVAAVFRSLKERRIGTEDAQRFVLQCVMAMFAEDVGWLPTHMFTAAVEDVRSGTEAFDSVGGLFREMNTPGTTAGGRYKGTPYFNGGLFAEVQPLELTSGELALLRDAAGSYNWRDVRPEIFGALFEGSMDADERHATGAHFTSQADILKIVLPTIYRPWRARIDAARTVGDYQGVLFDMSQFRVLDPACGSGNFLYVAYREMRHLEREALDLLEARRRGEKATSALGLLSIEQFHGIDKNPFAVEVAKVTMMLGKKLAADEVHETESVLPLDNLDSTIVCADALCTPWPRADAIIGNPPFIGRLRMTEELGADYVARLNETFGTRGMADFVTYWFPLAHDHLPEGGRAGLVGTNSIRQGDGKKASLDYIVDHGGAITDAVSSQPWSGDAVVHVSIVNWQKGGTPPTKRTLWVNDGATALEVDQISSALSAAVDLKAAARLACNRSVVYQGQTLGVTDAFAVGSVTAARLVGAEPSDAAVIFPSIGGQDLLHKTNVDTFVIDIAETDLDVVTRRWPKLLQRLSETALVDREAKAATEAANNARIFAGNPNAKVQWPRARGLEVWWTLWRRRPELLAAIADLPRYIALTRTTSFSRGPVFTFVQGAFRPTDSVVAFPFSDDYSLGILQSRISVDWYRERCTTLKADPNYTTTTVGDSFPWPQSPSQGAVDRVAKATAAIVNHRARSFALGQSLASQYDALRQPGKSTLRSLHDELDAAVCEAYGFDLDGDTLAQLLGLNLLVAEREADGEAVTTPGQQPASAPVAPSTWSWPAPSL